MLIAVFQFQFTIIHWFYCSLILACWITSAMKAISQLYCSLCHNPASSEVFLQANNKQMLSCRWNSHNYWRTLQENQSYGDAWCELQHLGKWSMFIATSEHYSAQLMKRTIDNIQHHTYIWCTSLKVYHINFTICIFFDRT